MADDKHVDESWKDAVSKEKNVAGKTGGDPGSAPEGSISSGFDAQPQDESCDMPPMDFISYISSLAFQAMIFLGDIPSPITDQLEKNLAQAKLIIDTLAMLKEKTAGNLSPEEDDTLSTCVYELQMKYVQAAQKGETA